MPAYHRVDLAVGRPVYHDQAAGAHQEALQVRQNRIEHLVQTAGPGVTEIAAHAVRPDPREHAHEHRQTVQGVLDELGAGDKPRVVALNKADLYDGAHSSADLPAPVLGDVVPVSALTGYGLDTLRVSLSGAITSLWEHVDVKLPYAEGELLARVRERGTVEVDYREGDVHIEGRVVPSLAGELRAAASRWQEAEEATP